MAEGVSARLRRHLDVRLLPSLEPLLRPLVPHYRGRRQRALRMGSYDEWTIAYDPVADAHPVDQSLLALGLRAAEIATHQDLHELAARTEDPTVGRMITTWPGEHYRLLYGLAASLGSEIVLEVGTSTGASALAFAAVPTVRAVHTYDIRAWDHLPDTLLRPSDLAGGVHPHCVDIGTRRGFEAELKLINNADLIFLDGPKDGHWERSFMELLLANTPGRQQLIVFDDIRVLTMLHLWRDLPLPKVDLTSLGHWSGTGLAWRA